MIRHLTTLVLCGVLGSMVLVGNAEACHKKNCGHRPVVCGTAPAPCVKPDALCQAGTGALRDANGMRTEVKHCGFKLPTFCHKKPAVRRTRRHLCRTCRDLCPTPVYYSYAAPVSYPTATPQASAQH